MLLADLHIVEGRLRRTSRDGVVGEPVGVLEDYGCVAEAFCAMHQLTGEGRWLTLAGELLDVAVEHFADGKGGFFDTADDAERLITRPADPTDNATPSGLSALAAALTAYSALTGEIRYREVAERAVESVAPVIARHARYAGYSAATAEALLSGPYEIAISTDGDGAELVETARMLAPPGAVIVVGAPDSPGVPLLAGRPMFDGRPTAYVCRGFVCDRPVTVVDDLAALLANEPTPLLPASPYRAFVGNTTPVVSVFAGSPSGDGKRPGRSVGTRVSAVARSAGAGDTFLTVSR
jgi:uncharacterized protein YyaL (SSP411 family)